MLFFVMLDFQKRKEKAEDISLRVLKLKTENTVTK